MRRSSRETGIADGVRGPVEKIIPNYYMKLHWPGYYPNQADGLL